MIQNSLDSQEDIIVDQFIKSVKNMQIICINNNAFS